MENVPDEIVQKLKDCESECPIIFETNRGSVVHGVYIKPVANGYAIDSVCQFPAKENDGVLIYFANEMKYLHVFYEQDDDSYWSVSNPALSAYLATGISSITYEEFIHARDLIWESKYIPVYDCNFQNTLREIRAADTIGIVAIGSHSNKVRYARISFFVISTRNKVYLFDIIFTPDHFWDMGLRSILEDKNVQKVVYDGKTVADLLLNRYKIKIANVFDVMVADYELSKICEHYVFKSFPQLIQSYLSLPEGIFEYTELIVRGVTHKNRPVKDKMKRDVSLIAVFLIPLCHTQKALLLQNFYKASQVYSDLLISRSPLCREEKVKEMGNSVPEEIIEYLEIEFQKKVSCHEVPKNNCDCQSTSNELSSSYRSDSSESD